MLKKLIRTIKINQECLRLKKLYPKASYLQIINASLLKIREYEVKNKIDELMQLMPFCLSEEVQILADIVDAEFSKHFDEILKPKTYGVQKKHTVE